MTRTLHEAFCNSVQHTSSVDTAAKLDALLTHLAQHLSADDYNKAKDLLWAAIDPIHAVNLNKEAANQKEPPQ